MPLLIYLLLGISVLLNTILIYRLLLFQKGAEYIASVLSDMYTSGYDRRVHVGNRSKPLENLARDLNLLMDRFQQTMDEKQKLEISHRQLISNISHDIRTPLTSLLGYVEVLLNGTRLEDRERKEYLEIVQSKGLHLYQMIQEFFELSKLESEENAFMPEKTDLAEIVRDAVVAFYQELASCGIVPELSIPETPVYVRGCPAYLERVLQNLITNAVKYGKDGGVIGISLREEGDAVWVDIRDKGKGIPEKDLPYIFNRLYTAEASRNATMHGSGLGLAIAKQLVEKQGGEISAASIPGVCTTFSFQMKKWTKDQS